MMTRASQAADTPRDVDRFRDAFRRDGFVALRGFVSAAEIAEIRDAVAAFIRDRVPVMPAEHVFYDDKRDKQTLKQLQRVFDYEPFFHGMMFGSRFERLAAELLDDRVVGWNMQYFNKPPAVGQATPPHQDGYYFMLSPCEAVTMWLALEPVDEENGCVRYVRASHVMGMRPHGRTQTLGFSQGITDFGKPHDVANEVAFPAEPGDLLVHHAMTIHRADGNASPTRTRQALGFIYYAAKAKEDRPAREAYQRRLNDELKGAGKL